MTINRDNYSQLRLRVDSLLGRCDGATPKDGAGFNKYDSHFARDLADRPFWTYKQANAVFKMLGKYRVQLAGMGLDYTEALAPVDNQPQQIADWKYRKAMLSGDRIVVDFKCGRAEFQPLLDAVRGIPGRVFDMATKTWNAPLNNYTVDALEALGFDIDENLVKWKENNRFEDKKIIDFYLCPLYNKLYSNGGVHNAKRSISKNSKPTACSKDESCEGSRKGSQRKSNGIYTTNCIESRMEKEGVRSNQKSNAPSRYSRETLERTTNGAGKTRSEFSRGQRASADTDNYNHVRNTDPDRIHSRISDNSNAGQQCEACIQSRLRTSRKENSNRDGWHLTQINCAENGRPEENKTIGEPWLDCSALISFNNQLSLYPFQKEGIAFLEAHQGRAFIADEQGLGKTIEAIYYLKIHPELRPAIIVVPNSLKINWERELKKWCPSENNIQIISGSGVAIQGNMIIINYDILIKYTDAIRNINPQIIILDEAHYIRNIKAKRTKAVRDISKGVKHIIALSGTPIVNRPVEFYSALSLLAPQMFPSFYRFAQEFCAPEVSHFGTTYKGATNTEKLNDILKKSFMIRRLKKDVLKDLPAKVRTVVPMDTNNREEYNAAAEDLVAWLESIGEDDKAERASRAEAITRVNVLKQMVAKGKMDSAMQWIDDFTQDEKLVVFCVHHATIDTLMERFGDRAVKLDGRDSADARQYAIDEFQNNADIKLFVGNIKAAGVGVTLTAASCTAFVELGWTSSDHDQAEDRVHRIGQEADSVNAYYLLGADTIEEDIAALIDKKRKVLDAVLDGHVTEEEAMIAELMKKLRRK